MPVLPQPLFELAVSQTLSPVPLPSSSKGQLPERFEPPKQRKLSPGAIVGISVGVALLVLLIILYTILASTRYRRTGTNPQSSRSPNPDPDDEPPLLNRPTQFQATTSSSPDTPSHSNAPNDIDPFINPDIPRISILDVDGRSISIVPVDGHDDPGCSIPPATSNSVDRPLVSTSTSRFDGAPIEENDRKASREIGAMMSALRQARRKISVRTGKRGNRALG
ncbi:hypothetical protein E1B28_006867 [Marasmius oreades]|uniref:Uncharacterized protein n=1 Tax=Marasmius oreades TaxID=181124 RepID=A0A9P7S256_9AGAR|nr:uncharacterized protein E1B28_006867 [Marasmius oreades]KAG7093178.1 hypothetical protein E1B28_006867 [Marasmius oreades]